MIPFMTSELDDLHNIYILSYHILPKWFNIIFIIIGLVVYQEF